MIVSNRHDNEKCSKITVMDQINLFIATNDFMLMIMLSLQLEKTTTRKDELLEKYKKLNILIQETPIKIHFIDDRFVAPKMVIWHT